MLKQKAPPFHYEQPQKENSYGRHNRSVRDTDDECAKKDEKLREYKRRLFDFGRLTDDKNLELKRLNGLSSAQHEEITRLREDVQAKNVAIEEYKMKANGIKNFVDTMKAKESTLLAEKNEALKRIDALNKQLKDKEQAIDALAKKSSEKGKSSETTIKLLKQKIRDNEIALQGNDEFVHRIECLENEVEVEKKRAKEYKQHNDNRKGELNQMRAENQKLKTCCDSLKRQRAYFEKLNEKNKRKFIGVSHTVIKQKHVYQKVCRGLVKQGLDLDEKSFAEIIEFLNEKKKLHRTEKLKQNAQLFTEVRDGNQKIEAQEKRIIEKAPNDRVNCGSCSQTFDSTGTLTAHMTIKHHMNTQDRSKNNYELITID